MRLAAGGISVRAPGRAPDPRNLPIRAPPGIPGYAAKIRKRQGVVERRSQRRCRNSNLCIGYEKRNHRLGLAQYEILEGEEEKSPMQTVKDARDFHRASQRGSKVVNIRG